MRATMLGRRCRSSALWARAVLGRVLCRVTGLAPVIVSVIALVITLGLALGIGGPTAQAAEPPGTPLLRVETGTHVNVVRAVAVDAAGRWAVTASDDKTARVWEVATGAPGPVLRVPMGDGAEGRLQAVVITPDGALVAVAGSTGVPWEGTNAVHVFDRASGALLRRINTGSAQPVVALALSADARMLAVGLGGNGGLRVLDFNSGASLAQDTDYTESIYALDFSADGKRLVSGGADGRLRLYSIEQMRFRLAAGGRPPAGKLIAQARFSPDGQLIAVGFEDLPQVLVLDGSTLAQRAAPNTDAAAPGAFSSLAWSPDGSELWGAGSHREGGQWLLRGWPRADFRQFTDRPAAGASVLALATLPTQRVLFVSGEPAWGILDVAAQAQPRSQPSVASFNSLARQFQISADGKRVRFWYGYRQPLFEFDLPARALAEVASPAQAAGAMLLPRTEARGMQVESWENKRGTTLNGRRLPTGELETSRSLAIASDAATFMLGTDEGLWRFDASGRALWMRRTPALVWAVNITADGRTVLTAGQDGVLRWYRASDGAELMALLPHVDRRRWVLWTPSGNFDAAVGAEDLLGWHVNRSASARPDFFPLRTLRARLYRPDVLDRLLDLLKDSADEPEALRLANAAAQRAPEPAATPLAQALPPVLELAGVPDVRGPDREARLRVRVRTLADAPVTSLRARADGRPAEVQTVGKPVATGAAGTEERDIVVRFNGQPGQLQLVAENRNGPSATTVLALVWPAAGAAVATADAAHAAANAAANAANAAAALSLTAPVAAAAATVVVAAAPAAARPAEATPAPTAAAKPGTAPVLSGPGPAKPAADFNISPKLYILAIGVGRFTSKDIPKLELTGKDVRDFVAELKKQQGKLYRAVETRVLVDQAATRDAIVDGLDWLQRQVTQHDIGMLFVSGHGTNDPQLGYLYVPYNYDPEAVRRTGVNMKDFQKTLDSLAGKALFFIDTCHSGNVLGGRTRSLVPNDVSGVINELISAESGVVVFSTSTGRQEALEDAAWGNGAFTKALVEGLSGKADFRKSGRVTHKMLDLYITERVKELTKGKQSPVTQAPGGVPDFPLAVTR